MNPFDSLRSLSNEELLARTDELVRQLREHAHKRRLWREELRRRGLDPALCPSPDGVDEDEGAVFIDDDDEDEEEDVWPG
jgi:hypothetical protein